MSEKKPQIWGHRGHKGRLPENTLCSFRSALEAGADGVELDVQKTSDGEFVVIHDGCVERTTNGQGRVNDLTLDDLQSFDAGGGERIPSLQSVLTLVATYEGKTVDVELKGETLSKDDFAALDSLLSQYPQIHFHMSSFMHELLEPFSSAGYEVGLLLGEDHQKAGFGALVKTIRTIQPAYLNLPIQVFDSLPAIILRMLLFLARWKGIKIAFWTVNTQDQWRKVRSFAQVLITDHSPQMIQWEQSISSRT